MLLSSVMLATSVWDTKKNTFKMEYLRSTTHNVDVAKTCTEGKSLITNFVAM